MCIRDSIKRLHFVETHRIDGFFDGFCAQGEHGGWGVSQGKQPLARRAGRGVLRAQAEPGRCLLYTSDAADERSSVDLGGRRIIKKKNTV